MTSVIPIPGWHHGSATMLHNPDLDPILDGVYVRYWHLADIPPAQTNVRYGGKSGHDANQPLCRLMTHSGHRCLTEPRSPSLPFPLGCWRNLRGSYC